MAFKLGLVSGFAAGYYLGAKAGRQRYEQMNQTLRKLRRSEPIDTAAEKAKTTVDTATEKAKSLVESKVGNGKGNDAVGAADTPDGPNVAPPPPRFS